MNIGIKSDSIKKEGQDGSDSKTPEGSPKNKNKIVFPDLKRSSVFTTVLKELQDWLQKICYHSTSVFDAKFIVKFLYNNAELYARLLPGRHSIQ